MFTRKRSRSRESAVSQGTEEIIAADIEGRGEGDQGDISEIAGGLDESGIDQPFDYHYQITNNHPLGRLLLKNLSDLTNIAKKTNTKECEVNLKDFCYEFSSALDLEKEQLDERIRQNNEKFEKSLIEKELDSHKINASFTPPTEWGKHPTLTNLAKITAANKAFPGMSKFRGHPREGFLNIIEFFTVLRNAQEQCKLSEKEFIEKMIIASTGEAHEIISYCREQAEGVSDIYHSLLMRFDDRISVEEAKSRLLSFKATKSMNLARVQSQIMIYANRASAQYPVGPSRQNYYNLESCQALIKALPTNSQNIATTTYNSLTARLQEAPTYSVFTRALNNHRTIMDKDIRQYGVEPNRFNAGRYNNNNKRPRNSPQSYTRNTRKPNYSAYSVTLSSAGAEASGRTPYQNFAKPKNNNFGNNNNGYKQKFNNNYQSANFTPLNTNGRGFQGSRGGGLQRNNFRKNNSQRGKSPGRPTNNFNRNKRGSFTNNRVGFRSNNNNPSCSLCGYKNHKATDCRNIRDDSGNIKQIIPTMGVCNLCPKFITVRLHHPEIYCPWRYPHGILNKNRN